MLVGIWTQCTYRTERKTPMDIRRRLFSMACGVITVEVAGWVFHGIGGTPTQMALVQLAPPLVAAALAYFLVNTVLVAGAISLSTKQPLMAEWQKNFLWAGPSYCVSAAAVGIGAVVVHHDQYLVALVAAAPVYITYRAYSVYLGVSPRSNDSFELPGITRMASSTP